MQTYLDQKRHASLQSRPAGTSVRGPELLLRLSLIINWWSAQLVIKDRYFPIISPASIVSGTALWTASNGRKTISKSAGPTLTSSILPKIFILDRNQATRIMSNQTSFCTHVNDCQPWQVYIGNMHQMFCIFPSHYCTQEKQFVWSSARQRAWGLNQGLNQIKFNSAESTTENCKSWMIWF